MGEFWETIKGIWKLERHGTLSDHMRANRDIMMGKNPYTGKLHLQENTTARIKRLQKYQCTVSFPINPNKMLTVVFSLSYPLFFIPVSSSANQSVIPSLIPLPISL